MGIKYRKFTFVTLLLFSIVANSAIKFNLDLVRPWNKDDKKLFPTPLIATFKKDGKLLIFVGDHHSDQIQTLRHFEAAFIKFRPQIVVIENVEFKDGENPMSWANKYLNKSKEDLLKEGGIAANAARIAFQKHIPFIGGEPTIKEQMRSPFLLSQKFSVDDILNVQVLQRIPYRRDKLNMIDEDVFFAYAMKSFLIEGSTEIYKDRFKKWYKMRTGIDFNYSTIVKEETAVNCTPSDTDIQRVACAYNMNRDRFLVENIGKLLLKYDRVLVAYGTGHFVQEYPVFVEAFGMAPEYLAVSKGKSP